MFSCLKAELNTICKLSFIQIRTKNPVHITIFNKSEKYFVTKKVFEMEWLYAKATDPVKMLDIVWTKILMFHWNIFGINILNPEFKINLITLISMGGNTIYVICAIYSTLTLEMGDAILSLSVTCYGTLVSISLLF